MKNIAFFCVTYNSYNELYDYYNSLLAAASENDQFMVNFFVADNTETNYEEVHLATTANMHPHIYPFHENLGYFGAIRKMMQSNDCLQYDYVILSNVDMTIEKDCLKKLCELDTTKEIGWIAPQIMSQSEHRDLNPAILKRYTKRKLECINFLYVHPWILRLYEKTLYKRKRISSPASLLSTTKKKIYAGHGSFIILTKEYIKRCGIINYPVFLYDEELYLAEECRIHSLQVVHIPDIKIYDIGKVSTGKMHSKFYCKYNAEGINYILKTYY